MKSLGRRIKGSLALAGSAIGITMLWSQALGQSTPDVPCGPGGPACPVLSEPATGGLFAVAVGALYLLHRFTKRK
jgi:hypothetical protein